MSLPPRQTGRCRIPDRLTLDGGSLTIEPFAELSINQHVVLAGNGQILLNGTPQNALFSYSPAAKLPLARTSLCRTRPEWRRPISRSTLPVINQGTISAETSGRTLVVDGSLQNTGLLQARNGATLRIDADNWVNEGIIHLEQGVVSCRSISVINGAGAMISGNGVVEFQQTQFTNQGVISPGSSIGSLDFRGGVR